MLVAIGKSPFLSVFLTEVKSKKKAQLGRMIQTFLQKRWLSLAKKFLIRVKFMEERMESIIRNILRKTGTANVRMNELSK